MNNRLPVTFPPNRSHGDYNPAIRLFGSRFFSDQSIVEFAIEFLGITFFDKWIESDRKYRSCLIPIDELKSLLNDEARLHYNLPIKLNLKLVAFFSSSRLDSRHSTHMSQYKKLIKALETRIVVNSDNKHEIIERIEELIKSFQGAGYNRTWCAKNFYPLTKGLIAKETLWNESIVKRSPISSWTETINNINTYYSISKHRFMARGGELLYLQLCNVFLQDENIIKQFAETLKLNNDFISLHSLHASLQLGFEEMRDSHTGPFDRLVNFIELLDEDSHMQSNKIAEQSCDWCPQESWQEGYIFAVELNRILHATLDPVDKLEMLMTGCALQVLRSLCAQSVRYAGIISDAGVGGALGYAWIFSNPQASERQQRIASQRNLLAVQGLIQKALRHDSLVENAKLGPKDVDAYYREADTKYGHKLFLSLGKKLGIIVPLKGRGARFIMTDKLIRYLVLTVLPPGSQCTYNGFLEKIYMHLGIAIESEQLSDAISWTGLPGGSTANTNSAHWLSEMLRAGGFLTELSDACSIINNPFAEKE